MVTASVPVHTSGDLFITEIENSLEKIQKADQNITEDDEDSGIDKKRHLDTENTLDKARPSQSAHHSTPLPSQSTHHSTPLLSYEAVMWTLHITICVIACLDRFYWNLWPRETYKIGAGSAGTDRIHLKEGPWSVKFFDIIARASGRFSIVTLNLLFIVRLKTIEDWLAASWISRYVIDCSNIVKANVRLHIWNGVGFCTVLLLHVWSILFPCLFHRYGAQVVPGYFEYPLSERAPPGFKDADAEEKMMSLQVDDVFRMVEMTVTLGVLIPLSNYWFKKRYHIAIHIHRVAAVIVFLDIVRRHSHPHSILLNSPIFFLWLMEKAFMAWTQSDLQQFYRIRLGDDYMAIFWNSSAPPSTSVGPNFLLRLKDSSMPEPFHAFTSFQNRNCLRIKDVTDDWTTGIVMRVYHNKRKLPLSKKDGSSHTGRLYTCLTETSTLQVRGPYTGEMSELIKLAHHSTDAFCFNNIKLSITKDSDLDDKRVWSFSRTSSGSVVLIGTGSGVNYLIDTLQTRSLGGRHDDQFLGGRQLVILWSTRDSVLYNWISDLVGQMISPGDTHLRIVLANTDKSGVVKVAWPQGLNQHLSRADHIVTHATGRIDFGREIPVNSHVFFQGSSKVGKAVRTACRKNNCWVYNGTGGKEVDSTSRKPPTVIRNPLTIIEDQKIDSRKPPTVIRNPLTIIEDQKIDSLELDDSGYNDEYAYE